MNLFRGLRVLYCAALFLGTLAILFLSPDSPAWLRPVLVVLWVLVVFAGVEALSFLRLKRINSLLDNCRVREYADVWRSMLPRAKRSRAFTIRLNLAAGYLELGQPRQALEQLEALPPIPASARYASVRLVYDNNLLVCRRMLEQLDEADALLPVYRSHLEAVPQRLAQRSGVGVAYESQAMLQRMVRGDFHGAIPFFEELLRTAPTLRKQTAAHFDLAWALHHEGRDDEARDHLAWAVANGGDTWYVNAARRKLEELP